MVIENEVYLIKASVATLSTVQNNNNNSIESSKHQEPNCCYSDCCCQFKHSKNIVWKTGKCLWRRICFENKSKNNFSLHSRLYLPSFSTSSFSSFFTQLSIIIFFIIFYLNIFQLFPFVQSTLIISSSYKNISTSLINYPLQNHSRIKRQQWWPQQPRWPSYQQQQMEPCPPQCFGCQPMNCQTVQCMQPQMVNMVRCCCRPAMIIHPQPDLKTACDGEEAVAACMNDLCGQGFFCNHKKFCCRCPIGKSLGNCLNGLCPTGYVCNSNNFCCAAGAGSVIGPCVNDKCPEGYECGAGNLCYARTSTSNINTNNLLWGAEATKPTKQPVNRPNFPSRQRVSGSRFGFGGNNRQRLTQMGGKRTTKRRLQQAKKRQRWGWGTGDDLFEPFADDWQQDEIGEEEIEGEEELGTGGILNFWG